MHSPFEKAGIRMTAILVVIFTTHSMAMAPDEPSLTASLVANGLVRPCQVAHAPGDASRIFVIEQRVGQVGRVRIVTIPDGSLLDASFLEISPVATGPEQGLLGIAFDPLYAQNGRFYVTYAREGMNFLERFEVSEDPNVADPESGLLLLSYEQKAWNHHLGWIGFGPDGMLYVPTGDGGSHAEAQNPMSLLGKILRLDVTGDVAVAAAGNPFLDDPDVDDRIWASGLRHPWRAAFDALTGDFWFGDVGLNTWEEINHMPAGTNTGPNFAWPCLEGAVPYQSLPECDDQEFTSSVLERHHGKPFCAVIGGPVYRGSAIPELDGTIWYADFCSGAIWSFRYVDEEVIDHVERTTDLQGVVAFDSVSSFGEDAAGEIYFCDLFGGGVFRIDSEAAPPCLDVDGDGTVGVTDLSTLITQWGPCGGDCAVDFDGDGNVNTSDLVALILAWGPCH